MNIRQYRYHSDTSTLQMINMYEYGICIVSTCCVGGWTIVAYLERAKALEWNELLFIWALISEILDEVWYNLIFGFFGWYWTGIWYHYQIGTAPVVIKGYEIFWALMQKYKNKQTLSQTVHLRDISSEILQLFIWEIFWGRDFTVTQKFTFLSNQELYTIYLTPDKHIWCQKYQYYVMFLEDLQPFPEVNLTRSLNAPPRKLHFASPNLLHTVVHAGRRDRKWPWRRGISIHLLPDCHSASKSHPRARTGIHLEDRKAPPTSRVRSMALRARCASRAAGTLWFSRYLWIWIGLE